MLSLKKFPTNLLIRTNIRSSKCKTPLHLQKLKLLQLRFEQTLCYCLEDEVLTKFGLINRR